MWVDVSFLKFVLKFEPIPWTEFREIAPTKLFLHITDFLNVFLDTFLKNK